MKEIVTEEDLWSQIWYAKANAERIQKKYNRMMYDREESLEVGV